MPTPHIPFWEGHPSSTLWQVENFRTSTWSEHVPFAFWLIDVLRPRTLVELGTWYGMSYLAFCQAIDALSLETTATAVDTWQGDIQTGNIEPDALASLRAVHDPRYARFSTLLRATFDQALDQFENESVDLLHIDGLHTYDAVRHDFETWLPKLSDRAVVLFHDTQERDRDFGVWKLWAEVSARYPHFEFVHEHGLGVLGVGSALPGELAAFFAASRDEGSRQRVRQYFERIGHMVRVEQDGRELRGRVEQVRSNPAVRAALNVKRALRL